MAGGAEFALIRSMLARWGDRAHGIGDDAAVLATPPGELLVVSTDAFVDGVHTRPGWLTPSEMGWRAVTAALSDLAAMGARPAHVLLAMTLDAAHREVLDDIADGCGAAVDAVGATIVGGNLARGDTFSIVTTVIGFARRAVRRSGARVGDLVFVTGELGGPHAAIDALYAGAHPSAWARRRFAHPEARTLAGVRLAECGATAMIDISDGLAADAAHLAVASDVIIRLEGARLPVGPDVGLEQALRGGEEYELLFTAAASAEEGIDIACRTLGLPVRRIGCVESRGGGSPHVIVDTGDAEIGARVEFPQGHDHFSR